MNQSQLQPQPSTKGQIVVLTVVKRPTLKNTKLEQVLADLDEEGRKARQQPALAMGPGVTDPGVTAPRVSVEEQ